MKDILEITEINSDDPLQLQPKAYQILRRAIVTGAIEPGERMIERKFAKQLGVSRTPIREAFRKLELEGLVKHIPNRGVVVVRISSKDAWEIYNIRSVLEGLAARLAAKYIISEEIQRLEGLVVQMEKAVLDKDMELLNDLHIEYNETICIASRSPRLHKLILNMSEYIVGFTKVGYSVPGRVREATNEHRELLDAIRMNDGDRAERIGKQHIERSCDAYFIQLAIEDEKGTR